MNVDVTFAESNDMVVEATMEGAVQYADIDLSGYAKKDEIPKALSEMTEDEMHRTVTDAEKQEWSAKSNFTRVLLWDNATFHDSNQCGGGSTVTVSEMGEEYSGVEVLFYCMRGGQIVSSGFIPKDTLHSSGAYAIGVTDIGELVRRNVRYSGNVFTFGAAVVGTTANNTYLLPWRIYGYK